MPFGTSFKDAFKSKLGAVLGAAVVAGLVAAGTWLYHYFAVPIEVSCPRGQDVRDFIAGEELRFALKGVESERVFWVFDEDQKSVVETMGPEIKYTFQFDPKKKEPVWNRRVDAFFKSGGAYRSSYKLVSVANTAISANIQVTASGVQLTVPPGGPTGTWKLDSAKLGVFENAAVADKMELAHTATGPTGEVWKAPSLLSEVASGDSSKKTWLSLTYALPENGQKVRIVKAIPEVEKLVGSATLY
jgi:hypothetical protein